MVRLVLGIVLMVAAFAELFLFIGGPENKLVADVMTSIICQRGERFTQVLGGYVYTSEGGGQSFNFYCQDEAGNQREVTGEGVIVGVLGYVIPFILGLVLVIVGPIGMARGRKKAVTVGNVGFTTGIPSGATDPFGKPINISDFRAGVSGQQVRNATVVTMNGQQAKLSDLPPETAQLVEQMLGNLGSMMSSGNVVMDSSDLTDKLQQLKEAHEKNLITQEEYDHLRKAILDRLGSE